MSKLEIMAKLKQINLILSGLKGNDKLNEYNTGEIIHNKQMLFHKCKKRNRWVFGGNRSGKTECGAVEVVWLARGIHPFKQNKTVSGWVVSLSKQVQRDVAQSKVLSYLHPSWIADVVMESGSKASAEYGVIDYILIKNVFGEISKIGFKSCDQGRDKFQGTSLDFVWFDEEPPEDIYKECQMRVLDRCGNIFGTMTPLKGLTWVYKEIYLNERRNPEIWCESMEWADNPFLDKNEIELLSASLSSDQLESRRYGKFTDFGGMVYNEFDENINVIEPFNIPQEWQDTISIDPGLTNPLSAHWYAVDFDGNIYVVAEHFESGKSCEYHANKIKEISNGLNWRKTYNGKIEALIDSAANQRTLSGEKSVAELFYDFGIAVNTKVNKDLYSGINRVKYYIKNSQGKSRLYIFKTCVNMIREIKGYFWGNADAPIKKDDHCLDELRYYLMTKPEPTRVYEPKTEIQKDKERLYKKIKNKYYIKQ